MRSLPEPRETLTKLEPNLKGDKLPLMIFVNKGIETGTQALTLEIIADTCGSEIARAATFIVGRLTSALWLAWFMVISLVRHLPQKVGAPIYAFAMRDSLFLV